MSLLERRFIGAYEIQDVVGRGGMATVYRAYQPSLERPVALKVIDPRYAAEPAFIESFRREARTAARLRHPNILTVHDFGQDGDTLYLVTELLAARTLRDRLADIRDPHQIAAIIGQLADALDYAHAQSIVHCDVKPGNVLFDAQDRPVLADFGIAHLLHRDDPVRVTYRLNPTYVSPEAGRGETPDGRSDQFALAVIANELLGDGVKEDTAVRSVLQRATAYDPNERYPTTCAFAAALTDALFPPDPTASAGRSTTRAAPDR